MFATKLIQKKSEEHKIHKRKMCEQWIRNRHILTIKKRWENKITVHQSKKTLDCRARIEILHLSPGWGVQHE